MMIELQDQIGNAVHLKKPASRIISLVPSQTEWLAYLGLQDEVKGITKFCVHPISWKRDKRIIGGTKSVHFDRIRQLEPDLIIGNKEENTQDVMEALMGEYNCYISDVHDINSALEMMSDIGKLTGREKVAGEFVRQMEWLADRCKNRMAKKNNNRVAYVIWKDPVMVAGSGTFIHEILSFMGWVNAFGDKSRYPVVESEDFHEKNVDTIFLSSEPYPFSESHFSEFQEMAPEAKVRLVDGELFSWYGWRLVKTLTILPDFE